MSTARTFKPVSALLEYLTRPDGSDYALDELGPSGQAHPMYGSGEPVLHGTDAANSLALLIGWQTIESASRTPGSLNQQLADAASEIWHYHQADIPRADEPNPEGLFSPELEAVYQSVVSTELTMAPADPPNNTGARVLRLQWDPSWTLAMLSRHIRHAVYVQWGDVPYSYTLHSDDDTACVVRSSVVGDLELAIESAANADLLGAGPSEYVHTLAAAAQRYVDSL